jgi:catechol 2,3-dioxygenase-like lactoylglutathione lyase family enzyme
MTEPAMDVALVTRDAERLAHFYRDGLGLEPAGELRVTGVLPDGKLIRLRRGGSTLKILQFDSDPSASAPNGEVAAATGLRYLTVPVSDLETKFDACVKNGTEPIMAPTVLRPGTSIAFLRDPDGNVVELVSFPTEA